MKKVILLLLAVLCLKTSAQNPGDTIKISAFKYGSSTRDTAIIFPAGNLSYEKILLKYNMRCKNGLISNQSQPNQGCGEWDYSCNTSIVDSSRMESELNYSPSHVISNFSGSVFPFSNAPVYDYYNYTQTNVQLNNINSESQYTLGAGAATLSAFLPASQRSGRSQLLFTAAELNAAGLSAGNIDGILLNVSNAGATTNFLKVAMRHSTLSALSSATVSVSGFTNVFNSNKTFSTGINRIQFHTPFVWDGVSNLIFDFSFTNSLPSGPLIFSASPTSSVMHISAQNNYAVDLSHNGKITVNPSQFASISDEITISFWAYGNSSLLPANTSILYAWANDPNQRHVNIHLPWGNSTIYFDCGFGVGTYDRINKVATAGDMHGQWNHWAFTKHSINGDMRVYLNGSLWMSGVAKTRLMSIFNMILGTDAFNGANYKGKVNEFTVWNTELSATDIQNWMIKPVNNTHPFYSNLLAYYPMAEGTGSVITDVKSVLTSTGTNMQWTFDRGDKLRRSFTEYNLRPNITFLRGSYSMSTNTLTVKDSVARNTYVVQQYSVISNNTVVPMAHDVVTLTATQNLYHCDTIRVYDGDTQALTGTLMPVPQGTITITQMPYTRRYPWFTELLSFVTPYGKGLDLGINGKTWYFDISDYEPLLKNKKRIVMNLGGEYQEQMDIDFLFIVGTPPRSVLDFNQLWQGGGRLGGVGAGSILNDTRFTALTVQATPGAEAYKLRSTITGHGQHGEFHQNGGLMVHYFNVDGGANEFQWYITRGCGTNPITAQGGTWIYDRQGWCPGEVSLTKEFDLSPLLTPGNTHTLDYSISSPPVPGGDYRYIVAHQLLSYSGPSRSNDARILDVMKPSNKVLYSKVNPVCAAPTILVQNSGSISITSMEIDYWVNNAQTKNTYTWTGSLNFMDTATVVMPVSGMWGGNILPSGNMFFAEIKKINGAPDTYTINNRYASPFNVPASITNTFSIEFRTNNNYTHNSYTLSDEAGNVVATSNFTAANTTYTDTYVLNGCYRLRVNDLGNDGLQWWANPGQGSGFVRIRDDQMNIVKTFNADFGSFFEFSFTTDGPMRTGSHRLENQVNVYPNPASEKLVIEGDALAGAFAELYDVLGRIQMKSELVEMRNVLQLGGLASGIYFVKVAKGEESFTRKIVVE